MKLKNNISFFAIGITISCTPQKQSTPKAELKKILDSVVVAKTMEITKEAKEDLDKRRTIEIKPLVDSFLKKNYPQTDTLRN